MKPLSISTQSQFAAALAAGAFKTATVVRLDNLPGVTALPDLPAATVVRLDNLPGVTGKPRVNPRGRLYQNGRIWR